MIRKLELLADGYFEIDMGLLVYGKGPYYGKKYMAALKPLLVIGDDVNILVDTGGGELPDKYRQYQRLERERSILDSLKDHGLAPADIGIVINTHLHFDHCGGNNYFKSAKFHVQRTEWEYAQNPHRFAKGGYIRSYFEDTKFELVDGEREIVDGITVIPTPGHTPGHQSVVVECKGTKYVYCGDVAPLEENLRDRNIVGILFDPVRALESIDKLRAIGGKYIYSHDREQTDLNL